MPEGPEIETVRRTLEPLLVGQRVESYWISKNPLRFAVSNEGIAGLVGKEILSMSCHGKLLWATFSKSTHLMFRLGMTGQLTVANVSDKVALHTHVRIKLKKGRELRYVDPRRFGGLVLASSDEDLKIELSKLGPDPLHWSTSDRSNVAAKIKASSRSIKELILDQKIMAGAGNIYASESLFGARISPFAKGSELSSSKILTLLFSITKVLKLSVENNGTTFSNFVDGHGKVGSNINYLKVFQRVGKKCPNCEGPIQKFKQGSRSTFYCAGCQN